MIDIGFNYLIGTFLDVPADYDYKNRPDPDSNGCKKLYDDIVSLFFSDYDAINLEQQFFFKGPLWKNKIAWDKYEKLNNRNPAKRTNIKRPPFYTIKYNDYLLSTDYIGPSIFWAENAGLSQTEIVEILNVGRTIGGHIAWPRGAGSKIETINQARGGEETFYDRIDWTLYLLKIYFELDRKKDDVIRFLEDNHTADEYKRCIRVLDSIENYRDWYMSFESFDSFCDRFKLKGSFVDEKCNIIWFAPMNPVLPENYRVFVGNNLAAIKERNAHLT